MATTQKKQASHPLLRCAAYDVTADNDVIFPAGGEKMIIAAYFDGLATALNIDAGLDAVLPFQVADDEVLNVTTTGAGSVELVWVDLAEVGYATQNT